jgi:hypothetical protein
VSSDGDAIDGASADWKTGSEAATSTTIGSSACPTPRHADVDGVASTGGGPLAA